MREGPRGVAKRVLTPACVTSAASLAEPDLLVVLGGPYLRLHGFPPWQVRLTEMQYVVGPLARAAPLLTRAPH